MTPIAVVIASHVWPGGEGATLTVLAPVSALVIGAAALKDEVGATRLTAMALIGLGLRSIDDRAVAHAAAALATAAAPGP